MIVLGSTSEVAQAFVEKALQEGERFEKIYLFTSVKKRPKDLPDILM